MEKAVGKVFDRGDYLFTLLLNICRLTLQLNPIKKDHKIKWKWGTYKFKRSSEACGFLFEANATFLHIHGSLEKHILMLFMSNWQAPVDRLAPSYINKEQCLTFYQSVSACFGGDCPGSKGQDSKDSTLVATGPSQAAASTIQQHSQVCQNHYSCNFC